MEATNDYIPWENIETVLLDMDGTLLDLHYDNHFWLEALPAVYAEKHGLSVEDTREHLGNIFRSTLGTLDFYCVDYWTQELDIDVVSLKHQDTQRIQYLPMAQQFLEGLRALASRPGIALTTNAHRKVYELKNSKLGLDQHFDGVFCANEFAAPKESARYWHKLQEAFPFDPRKTLLVDDNQNVLRAAKDYGIGFLAMPLNPDSNRPAQEKQKDFIAVEMLSDILPGGRNS